MKNGFHQDMVYLSFKLIQGMEDVNKLYQTATGSHPDEYTISEILRLKGDKAAGVFMSKAGHFLFVDFTKKGGSKNIEPHSQIFTIMDQIKSATPKTKISEGLIMVEPARFTEESLSEFFITNCGMDTCSSEIMDIKNKKTVTKLWIYMPSQEILFFKKKGSWEIDFSNFLGKCDLIQTFGNQKSDFNVKIVKSPKVLEVVETKKSPKIKVPEVALEMDAILDKISQFGIESLVKEEKDYLNSF